MQIHRSLLPFILIATVLSSACMESNQRPWVINYVKSFYLWQKLAGIFSAQTSQSEAKTAAENQYQDPFESFTIIPCNRSDRSIIALEEKDIATMHDLTAINAMRESIFALLARADETLYASMSQTMEQNFQGTTIKDPRTAYQELGLTPLAGQHTAHATLCTVIKKRIKRAEADPLGNKQTLHTLRQLGFIFRTAQGKENYDAWLKGQKYLEKLTINTTQQRTLQWLLTTLQEQQMKILESTNTTERSR